MVARCETTPILYLPPVTQVEEGCVVKHGVSACEVTQNAREDLNPFWHECTGLWCSVADCFYLRWGDFVFGSLVWLCVSQQGKLLLLPWHLMEGDVEGQGRPHDMIQRMLIYVSTGGRTHLTMLRKLCKLQKHCCIRFLTFIAFFLSYSEGGGVHSHCTSFTLSSIYSSWSHSL